MWIFFFIYSIYYVKVSCMQIMTYPRKRYRYEWTCIYFENCLSKFCVVFFNFWLASVFFSWTYNTANADAALTHTLSGAILAVQKGSCGQSNPTVGASWTTMWTVVTAEFLISHEHSSACHTWACIAQVVSLAVIPTLSKRGRRSFLSRIGFKPTASQLPNPVPSPLNLTTLSFLWSFIG